MSKATNVQFKDSYMDLTYQSLLKTLEVVEPDENKRRELCLDLTMYCNKQKHLFGEPVEVDFIHYLETAAEHIVDVAASDESDMEIHKVPALKKLLERSIEILVEEEEDARLYEE